MLGTDGSDNQIIYKFNDTNRKYPFDKTIHEIFEEQVRKSPNSIAAIYESDRITYKELNSKANQFARVLRLKGVSKDVIVGIMVERSLEMIIGIMAILKAGGAYMPISTEYPKKKIEYMVNDSRCKIVLTQTKLMDRITDNVDVICIDNKELFSGNDDNLTHYKESKDLIYVIYTSGSTGEPKGVMVQHYSVVNRLNWMQNNYKLNKNDTILQKTPFSFDVSVWELFWWIFGGAKVCFLRQNFEKFPQAIVETVKKNNITIMHFVPSMLNVFLNYIENSEYIENLMTVRHVFSSGEALNPAFVNKFNQILFKRNSTRLTNLYGPTETTVDVTFYDCPTCENISTVFIGKPIDNTQVFILRDNKILPVGQVGELCIAGEGIAKGYLNKPQLTQEKFVDNPMLPGKKMYKSGDLARILGDGNIEFLGRMDHQVKIRGLRIELGEIETTIINFNGIDQCYVLVRDNDKMNCNIIAYIVSNIEVKMGDLKEYLRENLPEYMIPNYFKFIKDIPLTNNGKVDRVALLQLN